MSFRKVTSNARAGVETRPYNGSSSYGCAITPLSLRDISPNRGISPTPTNGAPSRRPLRSHYIFIFQSERSRPFPTRTNPNWCKRHGGLLFSVPKQRTVFLQKRISSLLPVHVFSSIIPVGKNKLQDNRFLLGNLHKKICAYCKTYVKFSIFSRWILTELPNRRYNCP